jgi:hypothetical protein
MYKNCLFVDKTKHFFENYEILIKYKIKNDFQLSFIQNLGLCFVPLTLSLKNGFLRTHSNLLVTKKISILNVKITFYKLKLSFFKFDILSLSPVSALNAFLTMTGFLTEESYIGRCLRYVERVWTFKSNFLSLVIS